MVLRPDARLPAHPMSDDSPSSRPPKPRKSLFRWGLLDTPKGSERRQNVRYACSFPVTLRVGPAGKEQVLAATARDVSVGGMMIGGAEVPEGAIRVQVTFDLPEDVLAEEGVPRHVSTTASVTYRDRKDRSLSLAFSEPLRAADHNRLSADQWIMRGMLLLFTFLCALAYFVPLLAKYVVTGTVGFGVTLLLTPLVRSLAIRYGVVDHPGERRAHKAPTPRGGGLAVVIGFYCAALTAFHFPWEWSAGNLNAGWLHNFLLASGVLVVVGLLDDVRGLRPRWKLAGQLLAAGLMFKSGHGMGALLGFNLPVPVDFALTLFWFAALTNAFNLIDGLDGLAAGLALVACLGLMGAFFIRRIPSDAMLMLGLAGACLAFLRYNFHPATIFLGDTGSMFLGFTFAAISIATGSKGTFLASMGVPLLAVGVPVFDTILAIWRRSMRVLVPSVNADQRGKGLMQPDAEHLHHRLRSKGLKQHQIAVLLYVINGLLVITGLLSMAFRDHALGIFLVAFVAGAYVVVRHLAEVELWDTGRAIISGFRRPRRQVAAFFFYPIFDMAGLLVSFGISFSVVHLLQPFDQGWETWVAGIPIWTAPAFLLFCTARIYSRVWSLARTNDYLVLVTCLVASVLISTGLSTLLQPDDWRRYVTLAFIFSGLANVLLLGSRLFLRGVLDALTLWGESRYYRRGGVVRRVLLYGSGGRCLLYLRERALNTFDSSTRRMIVGLIDDDANLRFRRVGGYVVLGTGQDLPDLISRHRIDEIVITAQLRHPAYVALAALCACADIRLSEWHYEERVINPAEIEAGPAEDATPAATPAG
jgi:UDP-GlcNAc:undecaprenyl-phosphate GlcNAc-1-phosphate transferase